MPVELTTVDTLKEQVGIPAGDTSEDGRLLRMIRAASAAAENYCSREFAVREYTDIFQCTEPREVLHLTGYPVTVITEVSYGGDVLPAGDYTCGEEAGVLVRDAGPWAKETVVTYEAGYVLPAATAGRTLPYDLEDAVVLWCNDKYNTDRAAGLDSRRVDVLQESYESRTNKFITTGGHILSAPPAVMALLNPYRRMQRG